MLPHPPLEATVLDDTPTSVTGGAAREQVARKDKYGKRSTTYQFGRFRSTAYGT